MLRAVPLLPRARPESGLISRRFRGALTLSPGRQAATVAPEAHPLPCHGAADAAWVWLGKGGFAVAPALRRASDVQIPTKSVGTRELCRDLHLERAPPGK